MTAADTALARGSLFLFAAVDFVTPVAYLLLLFLALRPLWSSLFSEGEMDGTVLSLSLKALQRVVVLLVSAILLPGAMATRERKKGGESRRGALFVGFDLIGWVRVGALG